jgi:ribosomal protein L7/L12
MHLILNSVTNVEFSVYEVSLKFTFSLPKEEVKLIFECATKIAQQGNKIAAIKFLRRSLGDVSEKTFGLKEAKYLVEYLVLVNYT